MFKNKGKLLVSLGLAIATFSTTVLATPGKGNYGDIAYDHVVELSEEIGARQAGSQKEYEAMKYIEDVFKCIGYETEVQEFSYTNKGKKYNSYNVVATKEGKSSKELIVGGHYDSSTAGKGADDSASGIAVALEAAERLAKVSTPYTVKFVAFGAEEVGLKGSKYYVEQMSKKEIENTVAMINLDSLIAGDKMYVHGSLDNGSVREQALNIASKKKLNLEINPGLNPTYPEGTTGGWSDHAPFDNVGIPYASFEATNWELGDQDGYIQTEKFGSIWHTANDNLAFLEENFPGRVEERLSTFAEVLTELIKFMDKTSTAK